MSNPKTEALREKQQECQSHLTLGTDGNFYCLKCGFVLQIPRKEKLGPVPWTDGTWIPHK